MKDMLLNVESKELRLASLINGVLKDLIIERKNERRLTGNIYRGRVTNVLKNIQSAFIDIDEGDNGFIHISDILENNKKFEEMFDLDFETNKETKTSSEASLDIGEVLKEEQPVLVQVVKEPIGSKGARLTSNISVAGRYLVMLPNSAHRGVSRKIEDRSARDRLKRLIRSFDMPNNMGLICRTASCLASSEALIEEAHELIETWESVTKQFTDSQGPKLLFAESDLFKQAVLACVDKRYDRLLIDDYPTYQICKKLYRPYLEEHDLRIEFYRDKIPMFERFYVEKEIERSLRRKIWLQSGGYLFIDKTEAMTTIDINSGRSNLEGGDVEESLVQINMEAAEEIARQLRIRNVGGLVIIDFIDMRQRKNQRRVLDRLKECMKEDSAKCMILGMSEFGLVEMTRQRSRGQLMQTIFSSCPYCSGNGHIKSLETTSIEIERLLKKVVLHRQQYALRLVVHPEVYDYLSLSDKHYLESAAEKWNAKLLVEQDDTLHLNDFVFYSTISKKRIDV